MRDMRIGDDSSEFMRDNYRPPCPRHNRVVRQPKFLWVPTQISRVFMFTRAVCYVNMSSYNLQSSQSSLNQIYLLNSYLCIFQTFLISLDDTVSTKLIRVSYEVNQSWDNERYSLLDGRSTVHKNVLLFIVWAGHVSVQQCNAMLPGKILATTIGRLQFLWLSCGNCDTIWRLYRDKDRLFHNDPPSCNVNIICCHLIMKN